MAQDRFGNPIDPSVGYARGRFLSSSAAEIRRLRHAQTVAAQVVAARGIDAIGIFTGNPRYFPLKPDDLATYCEEWVGPGLFVGDLAQIAIQHFGGGETVAVTNRTSAGLVAAVLALADSRPVVSVVPDGDRSHVSVVRGCTLAGVELVELDSSADTAPAIAQHAPALVIITTVTSSLARMADDQTRHAIAAAKAAGATVFMDEAYGARLRPVLHGGALSLTMGADFAITNADKAGLSGPRAGILCGATEPVLATLAKASELGQEARAPITAGAMRSLQAFDPEDLRTEARWRVHCRRAERDMGRRYRASLGPWPNVGGTRRAGAGAGTCRIAQNGYRPGRGHCRHRYDPAARPWRADGEHAWRAGGAGVPAPETHRWGLGSRGRARRSRLCTRRSRCSGRRSVGR